MADTQHDASEVIDLREVAKEIWKRKTFFLKVWIATFILACLYVLPKPRTYTAELTLAPEIGSGAAGGTLADLASTFGFNMQNGEMVDAFYPELYPDVVASNEFAVRLCDIQIRNVEGDIRTDYYTYLAKHRKRAFYTVPYYWVRKQLKKLLESPAPQPQGGGEGGSRFNTFWLSEDQTNIIALIGKLVKCDVDTKTSVITLTVTDQDPLVAASVCDSVRVLLQDYITEYRTHKARIDLNYYEQLRDESRHAYLQAAEAYATYSDAHRSSILRTNLSEQARLENDMQLKLNAYNAICNQLQAAEAKVQERTPSFNTLSGATVPIKPTGPKRMIFVAAMLFLSTVGGVMYLFRRSIMDMILNPQQ